MKAFYYLKQSGYCWKIPDVFWKCLELYKRRQETVTNQIYTQCQIYFRNKLLWIIVDFICSTLWHIVAHGRWLWMFWSRLLSVQTQREMGVDGCNCYYVLQPKICNKYLLVYMTFSVAKATLQSQMSVHLFICLS